jgi:hypothetical protein
MLQTFNVFCEGSAYSKRITEGACADFFVAKTAEWNVVVVHYGVLQYTCEEFRIFIMRF